MIDPNKPLEAYSKEELLHALHSKKEIESYPLLKLVYEENRKSNKYYSCFDDFLPMIYAKSSFMRMRGFGLCSSLAKWDTENKIDRHLNEMLTLLEDEKPTTVRIVLSCIGDILQYKPYLATAIQNSIDRIDCTKYKDTMAPLIQRDIINLNQRIDSISEAKKSLHTERNALL